MEARLHATDGVRWRDAVDPRVEDRLAAAVDDPALLPVLDGTVARLLDLAADPAATTADLAAVVDADPPFAERLVRTINAATAPQPIRARTTRQALLLAGPAALPPLALRAAAERLYDRAPGRPAARARLHAEAVTAAAAAVNIAERLGIAPEVPHLAALLHDAGELVLGLAFDRAVCAELAARHPDPAGRARAERERLGVDHAVAGALLAERWNLPEGVPEAIALHHGGPGAPHAPTPEAAVVQLAVQVQAVAAGRPPDRALVAAALARCGAGPALLGDADVPRAARQPRVSRSPRSATRPASSVL